MSRSKRNDKSKKPRGSLTQFGLFDIPDVDGLGQGEDDLDLEDDADLEAELNAILGASAKPVKPVRKAPGIPGGIPGKNLDVMVAMSLKEDHSEGEDDDIDEDDPNLLAELSELTGAEVAPEPVPVVPVSVQPSSPQPGQPAGDDMVALLKERLDLYTKAESAARQYNDSSKARRYKRGIDQLKVLVRRAESGGAINQEDIPVPVVIPKPATTSDQPQVNSAPLIDFGEETVTPSPTPAPHVLENKDEIIATLTSRKNQYKTAAVTAKRNNDIESALSYIKIIKQFEVILEAVEKGQPVDLSTMPPPPPVIELAAPSPPTVSITSPEVPPVEPVATPQQEPPAAAADEEVTVMGALESRLAKYVEQEENAKREGNAGKARRMGRIVKQYREAIVLHKRGKPIPVDELPTPPGFPPIPMEGGGGGNSNPPSAPVVAPAAPTVKPAAPAVATPVPNEPVMDTLSPNSDRGSLSPSPGAEQSTPTSPASKSTSSSPTPSQASSSFSKGGGTQTRNEKQLAILLLRQREYREAAIKAKQANDLVKAKEYLKLSKGFDSVIEASRSGLPIDMDTLPRSLSKKSPEIDTFEIVRIADCVEGSDSEIFDRLLTDLKNQLKMCIETHNHFKAIGDIANANRFENLATDTKKDYNTVRGAHITCSPPPKFHYEQRTFSIVRCNVDLNDNDLELSIIKGINYNVPNPKEIDTYIRYEFPYPNDEIKSEKTSTVYNTNNPEYNAMFVIPIQRASRQFQRIFKRHAIKLHVWSKGGFLRSDQLLATVHVKLQPLETKCTIHNAFDLLDGRKALGGKVEVKVRLRNPIVTKQIEQMNEKWLVID